MSTNRPVSRGGRGGPVTAVAINMPIAQPLSSSTAGGTSGNTSSLLSINSKNRPSTPGSQQAGIPVGMRPPSSAGVPLGMRPPTAQRLGTAAINNSAATGGAAILNPLNSDVSVSARPVTQQGLSGMTTKPLGPSRQIADKNYFLTDLRNKNVEIGRECEKLREESIQIQKDNSSHAALERRYETVMKDVRQLEGELADFNLALDKLRTHTDINEIREIYYQLKQRNDSERNAVDEVFLKSTENEKRTAEYEEKIGQIYKQLSEKVAEELGEEKLTEYNEMQEENQQLTLRLNEKENKINYLDRMINQHSDTMRSEGYQQQLRAIQLRKEIAATEAKREELLEEIHSNASPAELKDRLTRKLKESNAEAAELEKQLKNLEESIESGQEEVRAKENELQESKKIAQKAAKYAAVYDRDKKMQEFIDNYAGLQRSEEQTKAKLQNVIVALLAHLSKQKQSAESLGNKEQFDEIKAELSFKQDKMKNAAETLAALQKDKEKRLEELEKITSLDSKISVELANLKDKMSEMNKEMSEFKSEEEIKEFNNLQKKQLLQDLNKYKRQKDSIKQQVQILSHHFESINSSNQSNEINKKLETLENKLRTYAQTSFQLEEFVSERKRQSEFSNIKNDCVQLTQQINHLLINSTTN
jgi:intraflagellar transport protein 74